MYVRCSDLFDAPDLDLVAYFSIFPVNLDFGIAPAVQIARAGDFISSGEVGMKGVLAHTGEVIGGIFGCLSSL